MRRAAPIAALLVLAGCLERVERITVEPDGTVTVVAEFVTDSREEFSDGDAVPSLVGAWLVEDFVEEADDGGDRFRLVAESMFPPDVPLPENFAAPGDPDFDLYLQFPTTVTIEDRPDAVYYHFHRRYVPRAWAEVEKLRELILEERQKRLDDRDFDELPPAQRRMLVNAYVEYEAARTLSFARDAFLAVTPDEPQDHWLAVEAEVRALKHAIDHEQVEEAMAIEDEQERNEAIADILAEWEQRAFERLREAVQIHCAYAGVRLSDFLRRYERNRRAWEITADLGDDVFEITVRMPGEIVGSNADRVSGGAATWRFSGKRFRDRAHELMVSSRVSE